MKKQYTTPLLKGLGQLTVITQDSKTGSTFDNKTNTNDKKTGGG